MVRSRPLIFPVAFGLATLLGCHSQERPTIDWTVKENFFLVEKADKNDDDSVRLEYHSLVDAPAAGVYAALAEPENYAGFVTGVSDSGKVSAEGNSRIIHITQSVIGRQSRAKVKYSFDTAAHTIDFKTLESDLSFNDGHYEVIPSPDGKRSYVITIFNVREKTGLKTPPGMLMSATRAAFENAARSVKARALGQNLKVPG